MNEIIYRSLELSDIRAIVQLHMKSMQGGLLYDMGEKQVGLLYTKGLRSGNGFGFVAESGKNEIIGMAFATKDIYGLFLRLLASPKFLAGLARRILRIKRLYPSFGKKMHVRQEFLMLFIEPKWRDLKTALKLMQLIDEKYEELGIKKYSLEVEAKNATANMLYKYFGFNKIYEIGNGNSRRIFYVKDVGRNETR